jgi:hypothetical protein
VAACTVELQIATANTAMHKITPQRRAAA